jgi:hypothetical protein
LSYFRPKTVLTFGTTIQNNYKIAGTLDCFHVIIVAEDNERRKGMLRKKDKDVAQTTLPVTCHVAFSRAAAVISSQKYEHCLNLSGSRLFHHFIRRTR